MTTEVIDCRGLKCPLPVLKLEKRAAGLAAGQELVVLATDPMAKVDIPLFCTRNGFNCAFTMDGEVMRFAVTRS